ncbi:MAG: nickel-responsive transcriptional regulator NikR [Methanosarcinales archaeon]|nr:nickel-responsive transcriptional regulator NikR [Methanosarcinales archaeon]
MNQDMMRIGVSLPNNLLEKFDEIIARRGYSSRSEGIRDAIRTYILNYEWMSDIKGERFGVIQIIYNPLQKGLANLIAEIQHEFIDLVQSSFQVPLDSNNIIEVIFAHGEGNRVKSIAERLMSLKGVTHVKFTTISPTKE